MLNVNRKRVAGKDALNDSTSTKKIKSTNSKKENVKSKISKTSTKFEQKGAKPKKFTTFKKNGFQTDKAGAGKYGKDKFNKKPNEKAAESSNEKTDWNKFKKDKKELKLKRKQTKDSYQISIEAKQIYEKLKCRRTEKKSELVEKLYNLLSANDVIKKLVMAHDTARIIQCMLKFATPSLREQISDKLLPLSVDMSMSKYSHFCVLRMFKYGSPSTKSKLVDSFLSNIVKLACHNISSKILDHVYLTTATAKQKAYMRQEFYGELYRKSKDDKVKNIVDTYKDTPNMKTSILGCVKTNLEHVVNKQLVDSSLVHAIMLEYLNVCEEDKVEEIVTLFAPLIPLMLTTKDGCKASILTFYKSSAKNRRAIIKTIKEHLVKICTHEHGYLFIIAVLNSLDDTKAIKKAIYDTIHPEIKTIMANQSGRYVVEWLVAPDNKNCFHPSFIATMTDGLQYGKKDKELRRKEIFEQIEEPLATEIAANPEFWFSNRHIGLVTADILNKLNGENFVKTANALAGVIVNPSWNVSVTIEEESKTKKPYDVEKIVSDANQMKKQKIVVKLNANTATTDSQDNEPNSDDNSDNESNNRVQENNKEENVEVAKGIEEAGFHIVLKKIIKHDKERLSQNEEADTFGSILINHITEETFEQWSKINRACFVMVNVLENNNTKQTERLKELAVHVEALRANKSMGAQLLIKKLGL